METPMLESNKERPCSLFGCPLRVIQQLVATVHCQQLFAIFPCSLYDIFVSILFSTIPRTPILPLYNPHITPIYYSSLKPATTETCLLRLKVVAGPGARFRAAEPHAAGIKVVLVTHIRVVGLGFRV